ncbi:hypothetical protein [Schlesneria paludicola]|uniref:hypothetical protein n=1 Tax=Schlesneria paludicola TaxID=360056 RepID=UPI00031E6B14|nr:hypothetical protein [Schlesneria paludicola]
MTPVNSAAGPDSLCSIILDSLFLDRIQLLLGLNVDLSQLLIVEASGELFVHCCHLSPNDRIRHFAECGHGSLAKVG